MKVKLLGSWCDSKQLAQNWNKMTQGNFRWNNITIVWEGEPDYYVVINSTTEPYDKKRTILVRMEPLMELNGGIWRNWSVPNYHEYLSVISPPKVYNNLEWHISTSYTELMYLPIEKDEALSNVVSTVLSEKYIDKGQIKRVDFTRYLENIVTVHVYGSNKFNYKHYKGSLPYGCKENALFPYKYTFNVENNSIYNYCTEKLIDGILSECLVFYSGCYNIRDIIDERAYIYLELSNFEEDVTKIKNALLENEWEKRLPYIREAKLKILQYQQFFPRLEQLLNNQKQSS